MTKRELIRAKMKQINIDDLDMQVALIQELIPVGLDAAMKEIRREVQRLTGVRYKHGKENVRWGEQAGSIYLRDQKVPIDVPRVRSKKGKEEIQLEAYQKLQKAYQGDEQVLLKLLNGISMHRYAKCAELVPEVFGISASNLSKRFKRSTIERIKRLKRRSLALYDIVCIFIDGKRYAKDGLLVVLGITSSGNKVILDIDHTHSENRYVIEQLFDRLFRRGLKYEDGILFIVDGSKGLITGIKDKFQEYAFIQRCQWHKRENVVSYLNNTEKEIYRRRLQSAYKETTYKEAKELLDKIYFELSRKNISAASSLREGLEETLTLHRLGLSTELRKSLSTTNCVESVMSQLGQYTDKVDRWRDSYQLLRWTAASLLEIEPMLKKIGGVRYLQVLRFKMKEEIKKRQKDKFQNPEFEEILDIVSV